METMKRFGIFAAAVLLTAACGGSKNVSGKGELARTLDQQADRGKYIEVIGIGAADQGLDNKTQRMALSRDAAIVKAQYELLTMVKKVQIEGGITVEQAMEKDSSLSAKVNEALSGAEVVKTEWTNDDGCVVSLRLPKNRLQDMMGVKFK